LDAYLLDAPAAARYLGVGERTFHALRRDPAWPSDATVRLSPRCVRFRVDRLQEFAQALSLRHAPEAEPDRLRLARASRRTREVGA
jgi:hypothetical protein